MERTSKDQIRGERFQMPVPERVRIPCSQPVRQPLRGAEIWDRSEADRRDGSNWLDAKVNLNDEALILLNDPGTNEGHGEERDPNELLNLGLE